MTLIKFLAVLQFFLLLHTHEVTLAQTPVALPRGARVAAHYDMAVYEDQLFVVLSGADVPTIYSYNGSTFNRIALPSRNLLPDLDSEMVPYDGKLYVVFKSTETYETFLYRYDGAAWELIPSPDPCFKLYPWSDMVVFQSRLFISYFDACGVNGLFAYDGSSFEPIAFHPRAQFHNRDMMEVYDNKLHFKNSGSFAGFVVYDGVSFTEVSIPSGHYLSVGGENYTDMEVSHGSLFFFIGSYDGFRDSFKLAKLTGTTVEIAISLPDMIRYECLYGMKNFDDELYLFLLEAEGTSRLKLVKYYEGVITRIGTMTAAAFGSTCATDMEVYRCQLYVTFDGALYTIGDECGPSTDLPPPPDVPVCIPNFIIRSDPGRGWFYLSITRDPCNLEFPFPVFLDVINSDGQRICTERFKPETEEVIKLGNQKPGEYTFRFSYGNEIDEVQVTLEKPK